MAATPFKRWKKIIYPYKNINIMDCIEIYQHVYCMRSLGCGKFGKDFFPLNKLLSSQGYKCQLKCERLKMVQS